VQSVVAGPDDSDDFALRTHHMRYWLAWWMKTGTGPGRQRANGQRGGATFFGRWPCAGVRRYAGATGRRPHRSRFLTGRARGHGQDGQHEKRVARAHAPDCMPFPSLVATLCRPHRQHGRLACGAVAPGGQHPADAASGVAVRRTSPTSSAASSRRPKLPTSGPSRRSPTVPRSRNTAPCWSFIVTPLARLAASCLRR